MKKVARDKSGALIGARTKKGDPGNLSGFEEMARSRRRTEWELRPRQIQYDDGWRDIMRRVSRDKDVPVEDVERILSAWWLWVWQWLHVPDLVAIKITYLCTLRPSRARLWQWLDVVGEKLERWNRGERTKYKVGDVKELEAVVDRAQEAWFRLGREQARRREVARAVRARVNSGFSKSKFEGLEYRRQLGVTLAEARALKKEMEKNKDK